MIKPVNINITCSKKNYIIWLDGSIFLVQPIYYTNKIPAHITPKAYWYIYVLRVLDQHGLLGAYKNIINSPKGS